MEQSLLDMGLNVAGESVISVVVPVYNVEGYLARCVESILGQVHGALQVILVDDGSSDGSVRICDEYAAKDERVQVIHQANGGPSSARNAGMSVAVGEYLMFVDGDDWIDPAMGKTLMRLCIEHGAGIAECSYESHFESENRLETACTGEVIVQTSAQALGSLMGEREFCSVVWNKLYRRSMVDGVRFPVGKWHEDEFVVHRFYLAVERIVYIDAALYHYERRRGDSYMSRGFQLGRLDGCEALRERMRLVWSSEMREIEEKMNNRYSFVLFYRLGECSREGIGAENDRVDETIKNALEDWQRIRAENRPIDKRYSKAYKILGRGMAAFGKHHARHMRSYEV